MTDRGPFFRCPVCRAESYDVNDIREGYCGRCHDFTGKRLAEIGEHELTRSGRMTTALVRLSTNELAVVLTVYAVDTTTVLGHYLIPPEAGVMVGEMLTDTSRKALEDRR